MSSFSLSFFAVLCPSASWNSSRFLDFWWHILISALLECILSSFHRGIEKSCRWSVSRIQRVGWLCSLFSYEPYLEDGLSVIFFFSEYTNEVILNSGCYLDNFFFRIFNKLFIFSVILEYIIINVLVLAQIFNIVKE